MQEDFAHYTQYVVHDIAHLFTCRKSLIDWAEAERCLHHPSVTSRLVEIQNGMVHDNSQALWKKNIQSINSVQELDEYISDYALQLDPLLTARRNFLLSAGLITTVRKKRSKRYKCVQCSQHFQNKSDLRKHLKIHEVDSDSDIEIIEATKPQRPSTPTPPVRDRSKSTLKRGMRSDTDQTSPLPHTERGRQGYHLHVNQETASNNSHFGPSPAKRKVGFTLLIIYIHFTSDPYLNSILTIHMVFFSEMFCPVLFLSCVWSFFP